ncbi:MAG: 16S rRNA (guanine1207-N2)-methyltransferase, partial [Paracoccaceae bacterium]
MKNSRLEITLDQTGLSLPDVGEIAVYRAKSSSDYGVFPKDRTILINSDRLQFDELEQQGYRVSEASQGPFSWSLVEITRSKSETLGLIALAFAQSQPGGIVVVDGVKTDGIESVLKQCKGIFAVENTVAKSHGKLFWMIRPDTLPAQSQAWQKALVPVLNGDGFWTAAGMFSSEQIDKGSALLAGHLDDRIKGAVADLGAGWGWLAAQAIKSDNLKTIDLFEAEKTALDAAK